jgi:hypothetical protein
MNSPIENQIEDITKLELLAEYILDLSESEIFSGSTFLELVSNLVSQEDYSGV